MKEKSSTLLIILLVMSAIGLSVTAAFFSVYGLSKVFAGASVSIIILGSVLEFAKIATAYTIHQTSTKIPNLIKYYIYSAILVLMLITSAGIYGYLSNAYKLTATNNQLIENTISVKQSKVNNYNDQINDYILEKQNISQDISQLRQGLSNNVIEYIDKETGQKVTTTSTRTRAALQEQLKDAVERRDTINARYTRLQQSKFNLENEILLDESSNEAAAKLGPLMYLRDITGMSMDRVMNYFTLLIVLVFDPLAICLVIAISYLVGSSVKTEITEQEKNPIIGYDVSLDRRVQPIKYKNSQGRLVTKPQTIENVISVPIRKDELEHFSKDHMYIPVNDFADMSESDLIKWYHKHKK